MISQDYLKQFFIYEPDTGLFRVRKPRKSAAGKFRNVGQAVGTLTSRGYLKISFKGSVQYLHRLAFLYMTGEMPETVDHVNGDRTDNRWANLRNCTQQQNCSNKNVIKSRTGLKGVTRVGNKFRAQIVHKHQHIHIGYFETAEKAHEAYFTAASNLNGDFATRGNIHA